MVNKEEVIRDMLTDIDISYNWGKDGFPNHSLKTLLEDGLEYINKRIKDPHFYDRNEDEDED